MSMRDLTRERCLSDTLVSVHISLTPSPYSPDISSYFAKKGIQRLPARWAMWLITYLQLLWANLNRDR